MIASTTRIRRGLTLVELMVAMGISLGIMALLAEAFKSGTDIVRAARATGDLSTQLNAAGALITRDLIVPHFLPEDDKPNRGVSLSDQHAHKLLADGTGWRPPRGGFVRIVSPQPLPRYKHVTDAEGYHINTTTNHMIHLTVILPGGPDQHQHTIRANNGQTYYSAAGEVAYFLVPSGQSTSNGAGGLALYNLMRRCRLVAMTPDDRASLYPADPEVIASNGSTVFTLADLANPANRPTPTAFAAGSNRDGEDLVLSNVLSFELLPEWDPNPNLSAQQGAEPQPNNTDYPNDYLAQHGTYGEISRNSSLASSQGVFDSWHAAANWHLAGHANAMPMPVRIKSLLITLRVFDPKTKSTRQNTWKVKM